MSELDDKTVARLRELARGFIEGRVNASLGAEVGRGASATVFELFLDEEKRALKVYEPGFLTGEDGPAEIRRLRLQKTLIGHDCHELVQVLDVHMADVNSAQATCFVEMEYVAGLDLNKCLGLIPTEFVQPLITQLVRAVRFLEEKGLAHRDVKPSNIKVSTDFRSLKLLDLGVLRRLDDDGSPDATAHGNRKPFIATAQYSSPEYLFWLEHPGPELWRALSIYQVGAVLQDLLTGKALFADEVASGNRYVLAMAVLQKVPVIDAPQAVPRLRALAARCLTKDMGRRLSMVNWDDFAADRTTSVATRLRRVGEVGLGPPRDARSAHERSLHRNSLADAVLQGLRTRLQDEFRGCQLELAERENGGDLIVRIPRTDLIVKSAIEFRWSDISKEETAIVFAASVLKRAGSAEMLDPKAFDVATLSGGAVDQVIAALYEHKLERIDLALDLAEANNGELAAALDLGERQQ
jgi:serine/threonine protein kinase